jgi:hypothetical protein
LAGKTFTRANKREVGRRLALLALNRAYGRKQINSGPIYDGMTIKDNKITSSFLKSGEDCSLRMVS